MKNLLLLLILLSVQKECDQKPELPFLYATSQNWSGGPAGVHGTYYKMYFRMKEDSNYLFDSLWVDERRFSVNIIKNKIPGDTLLVMANDSRGFREPVNQREVLNSVEAKPPVTSDAKGVLGYLYKGQRKYFLIPEWKTLKSLAYP